MLANNNPFWDEKKIESINHCWRALAAQKLYVQINKHNSQSLLSQTECVFNNYLFDKHWVVSKRRHLTWSDPIDFKQCPNKNDLFFEWKKPLENETRSSYKNMYITHFYYTSSVQYQIYKYIWMWISNTIHIAWLHSV